MSVARQFCLRNTTSGLKKLEVESGSSLFALQLSNLTTNLSGLLTLRSLRGLNGHFLSDGCGCLRLIDVSGCVDCCEYKSCD